MLRSTRWGLAFTCLLVSLAPVPAVAQFGHGPGHGHGDHRHGPGYGDRRARLPVPPPRMVFDHRFHGHWYPGTGIVHGALPGGYVVVRPPVGIVVPVLPPVHSTLWAGNVAYHYANETWYLPTPGGYAVVLPPPGPYAEMPPPPVGSVAASSVPPASVIPPAAVIPPEPVVPGALAPVPTGEYWFYCASARAYHPDVAQCPEGWRAVPTTPAAR